MLMNDSINNLKNGTDIRQSLIALKEDVRANKTGKTLAQLLAGDFSVLTDLLRHADPKVRKNAALILAELEYEPLREILWEAYQQEKTLFVRADYLKALSHYDCSCYLDQIKARMRELDEKEAAPEEQKHHYEEQTALKTLLRKTEKKGKHKFNAYDRRFQVILLTNREHREATLAQVPDAENVKMLAGGLRFTTEKLADILPIRTYSELLFTIPGVAVLEGSPGNIAKEVVPSLTRFLRTCHEQPGPFYFRLDVKTALPEQQRVDLVKKLARAMEKESRGELLNAPGGYEFELRLVANKAGRFAPLLKLYTIHDWRFAYRKESLPTSIAPVNAALIMELAKDYLREDARVLDPFCGVGTMLIERRKKKKCGNMYGVDILESAILKARENAGLAHIKVNYINRDFLDFKKDMIFDEIITNLPVEGNNRNREDVEALYHRFLSDLPLLADKNTVAIIYAQEYTLFRACLQAHPELNMQEEFCINERGPSYAVVLKLA